MATYIESHNEGKIMHYHINHYPDDDITQDELVTDCINCALEEIKTILNFQVKKQEMRAKNNKTYHGWRQAIDWSHSIGGWLNLAENLLEDTINNHVKGEDITQFNGVELSGPYTLSVVDCVEPECDGDLETEIQDG